MLRTTARSVAGLLHDPSSSTTAFLNLLSNAVKFTEQGAIDVEVAWAGSEITLRVRDTGIGMSDEERVRLFVVFEQADGSISRRFGGTGLGLAISHRIVTAQGGSIQVESTPGKGSTFTVRMPARVAETPEVAEAPASAPAGEPLAGRRVLVAEDNHINQIVIQGLLEKLGAQVDLVGDGQEAVERVRQSAPNAYHLVLMDVMMPVKDGITATRELRTLRPSLPIIGQTAHAFGEERDRCFEAGMMGHVAKPIDPDELLAVMVRHALPA
jgi:CheY-like chemotaxis protein/anti-sigma regulatory factor (Ser/Thr protein kinase)